MTFKELQNYRKENREKIENLKNEAKQVERAYCLEVLEKAGYHIGDVVTNKRGEKGIIVDVEFPFYPRAVVAKMKNDGTASKVTNYSLGFVIPDIEG